jgi:hypothetical protein
MEIVNNSWTIEVTSSSKNKIKFNTETQDVFIDDLLVTHPWEFEKAWILLEVKEYSNILFYSFTADQKNILIVSNDTFDLKEEILSFFWDVDVLIITWSKESAKIFENIEARIVVPYGEGKQTFLTNLWQHIETVKSYKVKWDLSLDSNDFVNLED